jgi:hypothetical protein
VKKALIAATTKTQTGGRKETAHINGSTSRLKIGKALVFIPPGVVTIFVVGAIMMLSTTRTPARLTCPMRLSKSATQRAIMLPTRIPINKVFDPLSAAGTETKRRKNRTILI